MLLLHIFLHTCHKDPPWLRVKVPISVKRAHAVRYGVTVKAVGLSSFNETRPDHVSYSHLQFCLLDHDALRLRRTIVLGPEKFRK